MAAVDLSNILGNALQAMFNGWAKGIEIADDATIGGIKIGGDTVAGAVIAIGILAAVVMEVWAVASSGGLMGIAVILITAGISVAVAILFLFILLAAREAAIVVLTILAPLALVCYMLPNTRDIFNKWLKLGRGLLLVYPIAGVLVGGGNFVSKILLAAGAGSEGLFPAFTAMIVGVVPIFFIPTVLKSSFSAMGNLGAKISGIGKSVGSRLSSKTGDTLRNSDRFQRLTNAADQRMPFKTIRANAAIREGQRGARMARINRIGSKEGAQAYMTAAAAAADARQMDEEVGERLSLMQSAGEGGGIVMDDGTRKAYTLGNMRDRLSELEGVSRGRALTENEHKEVAALMRGMAAEKGGAGMIGKIVRGASNGAGGANTNFMQAVGKAYASDGAVQSKMREKDAGASIYTEQFMSGGAGAGGMAFGGYQAGNDYKDEMANRVKSHAVGLSQSGAGLSEYLQDLNSGAALGISGVQLDANGNVAAGTAEYDQVKAEYQKIIDNQDLMQSLDDADRVEVERNAAAFGVTGKSATTVAFGEGSAEAQAMSNLVENTEVTAANTGTTAVNTGAIATSSAATAANTEQVADGVLQIHQDTSHIAATSGMVDVGFVRDRNGQEHHVRQTGDGRYVDDHGNDMGQIDPGRIRR